ncbi:hypothetical protein GCM10010272_16720 [Streptomyces lateritius]|nr:hypothetical protein GCM10010272_16720 [Streptomyces lateritius]
MPDYYEPLLTATVNSRWLLGAGSLALDATRSEKHFRYTPWTSPSGADVRSVRRKAAR